MTEGEDLGRQGDPRGSQGSQGGDEESDKGEHPGKILVQGHPKRISGRIT
jgi:hypothetical protein